MKVTVENIMAMKKTDMWWAIVQADEYSKKMWERLFFDSTTRACSKYCKTTKGTLKVVSKIAWFAAWLATQNEY